jgi:hypothetical protein
MYFKYMAYLYRPVSLTFVALSACFIVTIIFIGRDRFTKRIELYKNLFLLIVIIYVMESVGPLLIRLIEWIIGVIQWLM